MSKLGDLASEGTREGEGKGKRRDAEMKEWVQRRWMLPVLLWAVLQNGLGAAEERNALPFLSWHGTVVAGYVSYDQNHLPVQSSLEDVPRGIRLRAQPAQEKHVFFRRIAPWEEGYMGHFQVLRDGGRFRLWYAAGPFPEDRPPGLERNHSPFVCYAESEDGFAWKRPTLGRYEYQGSSENNIILSQTSGLGGTLLTLMLDPEAPASERYKGLFLPADSSQIVGAVSPDGFQWTRFKESLLSGRFDTQNTITRDHENGGYVMYVRSSHFNRRSVSLTRADQFVGPWSEPELSLSLSSSDPADADIYAPGYSRYPYGPSHLMFLSIYNRAQDTVDVGLAVSRDGEIWDRTTPDTVIDLETAEEGKPPFGSVYTAPGLFTLDEDTWGVAYVGHPRRHNLVDLKRVAPATPGGTGVYMWAIWKRDRLMALEAPDEGQFTLHRGFRRGEGPVPGSRIYLNYQADPIGWVKLALVEGDTPISGYAFSDCDPIRGDELRRLVTWKGNPQLPQGDRPVKIRVHLVKAKLFAVEFE